MREYSRHPRRDAVKKIGQVHQILNLLPKVGATEDTLALVNERQARRLTIDEVIPVILQRADVRVVTSPNQDGNAPYQARVQVQMENEPYKVDVYAVSTVDEAIAYRKGPHHDPLRKVILAASNQRTINFEFEKQIRGIGDRLAERS